MCAISTVAARREHGVTLSYSYVKHALQTAGWSSKDGRPPGTRAQRPVEPHLPGPAGQRAPLGATDLDVFLCQEEERVVPRTTP
jgi:hypothetical protein